MPTVEAPKPIAISQEGGPDFSVAPDYVPYYTEVLSAVAGKDMPEAQYVALAVASKGSHSQPQFNKPVGEAAELARQIARGADMLADDAVSDVPLVVIDHSYLRAGIATEDARLLVTQGPHFDWSYGAEISSSVPVLQRGVLHGEETDYHCDDPEKTFVVKPPGRVITGNDTVRKPEIDELIDTVIPNGILAVGEDASNKLLTVLARRELADVGPAQRKFGESLALLTLAYFREYGRQLPASKLKFVREAGHEAISGLVTASVTTSRYTHERSDQVSHVVQRLGGIKFSAADHQPIVNAILERMSADEREGATKEAFAGLAAINGGTVEEFASAQATSYLTNLLGVELR